MIADIPYLPDGGYDAAAGQVRGHLLDIYLPHEAAVRMSNVTPVYVDIHGGGFCYGYKELNRNFNTHLAQQGFAVVSLNYRPAPQTDLKGQLADVQAALRWLKAHLADYPVDPNAVFITGDSAGGALALLTLAIENSGRAAEAFGIGQASGIGFKGGALVCGVYSLASPELAAGRGVAYGTERKNLESTLFGIGQASGIGFKGGALVCGVYSLASPELAAGRGVAYGTERKNLESTLGPGFFAGLDAADPDFLTAPDIVANVDLPPLFLLTSADDFIQAETLALATALARKGTDFELHDWKPARHDSLGHVFPVCMTWREESLRTLADIRRFSYDRC